MLSFLIYLFGYTLFGFLFLRYGLRSSRGPVTNAQALRLAVPIGLLMALATQLWGS